MTPVVNERRIFSVLQEHQVPFVVIGGRAVIAHGFIRTTEDVDVIFDRTPATELRLLAALQALGATWLGDEIDPATGLEYLHPVTLPYLQGRHLLMLNTTVGFLDLFDYIPGHPDTPLSAVFADAIELDGIPYVSLAWLRRLKLASGRPQDLRDLDKLSD